MLLYYFTRQTYRNEVDEVEYHPSNVTGSLARSVGWNADAENVDADLLPLLRTVLPIDLIVHAHRVVRVEVILFEAELAWSTVAVHARERWRRHPGEVAKVVTDGLLHLTVEGVRTSGQVVVDEVPRLSIIIFDSQLTKRRILDLQRVAPCKEVAAIQPLQCLRCFRRMRQLDHRLEDRLIFLERHDLLHGAVSGKDRVEHFDAHWVHQIDHMNKENP